MNNFGILHFSKEQVRSGVAGIQIGRVEEAPQSAIICALGLPSHAESSQRFSIALDHSRTVPAEIRSISDARHGEFRFVVKLWRPSARLSGWWLTRRGVAWFGRSCFARTDDGLTLSLERGGSR